MRDTGTGEIQLIDFEYGGMNYVCFDIANHFNEFAGGTDDSVPKYEQLPDDGQKRSFIEAYVGRMYELSGRDKTGEGFANEVNGLLNDVEIFMLVNHFYWGCWGACLAATEGCEVFDYLNYSKNRLAQAKEVMGASYKIMGI